MKTIKKNVRLLLVFVLVLSMITLPVPTKAAVSYTTGTYKVTASSLRVRSGAGTSYSSLGCVKKGAQYPVTAVKKISNGTYWGKITFKSKTGWISLKYCTRVTTAKTSSSGSSSTGSSSSGSSTAVSSYKVTATSLRVRSGAGTNYSALGYVHKGDIYKVTATKTLSTGVIWGQIKFGTKTGWISLRYCTKVTTTASKTTSSVTSSSGSTSSGTSSSGSTSSGTGSSGSTSSGTGSSGSTSSGTSSSGSTSSGSTSSDTSTSTAGAASYKTTGMYLIGHRGSISNGATAETKESFTQAGIEGFWGIEGDPRVYNDTFVMAHLASEVSASSCTISDYLDICKTYGCVAVLDIKYFSSDSETYLKKLVDIVNEKGMMDQTIFQCSVVSYLSVIRSYSSAAHIWVLTASEAEMATGISDAQSVNAEGINVNIEFSDAADYIASYKAAGYKTCAYHLTTEAASSSADFKTSGADYYMCDQP